MKLNENYKNLEDSYLFATVSKKVAEYQKLHPDKKIIKLGIGDVTIPLCQAVADAMEKAVKERVPYGYGPYEGYDFLTSAIKGYYSDRKNPVDIDINEIFVSFGAKDDIASITDIFSEDNTVLIPDPVYPVYIDTNIMAGRKVVFVDSTESNGFMANPDYGMESVDIIYLCSPNNPTGAVYDRKTLKAWVDFAIDKKAVILFDAAYEAYIADDTLPRSIYEIEGAKKCAIELCSLSKTAGFTGTRCGYTIIPNELIVGGTSLNKMWYRRQSTKSNGVPYIVQRGAAAVFTPEGQAQVQKDIAYYMNNAHIITTALDKMKGVWYTGGTNSPYIWLRCFDNMSSWDFFDYLLEKARVVGTPGSGFGHNGENYFRITAFGNTESTKEAVERIQNLYR
jgi:LL-diaminopimelate aminotransferase